jgi:hypothetical protein
VSFSQKKLSCKVPIFFIQRLGSGKIYQREKKEKSWGCHLKKLITSAAFKNLRYTRIYRNCKSFREITCWKSLFIAFVRSKLEYGSLIWYPIYKIHVNRVETVQRRFLEFLIFLEEGNYPMRGINQADLLQRFNM